jgi:hypothetical protein
MKISELKCWPGYKRVKNRPAGSPGSCTKAEGYDPAASNRSAAILDVDNPLSPVGSVPKNQRKK